MHILTTAVVVVVVAGLCQGQSSNVPRPQRFRPSFTSTSSPSFGTRRPSDDRGTSIFTGDSDQNTFPGSSGSSDGFFSSGQPEIFGRPQVFVPGSSGSSDGFFSSGQPGVIGRPQVFVPGSSATFRPSGQGFDNPSTSTFGTPAPSFIGSQGGVVGQPVFVPPNSVFVGQPNTSGQGGLFTPGSFSSQGGFTPGTFSSQGGLTPGTFSSQGGFRTPSQGAFGVPSTFGSPGGFNTPVTFGSALPRQGGTIFTGLGSSGTSGTRGGVPSNTQFGSSGIGGAFPVILGQGGVLIPVSSVPFPGFFQNPSGLTQTSSGGFLQPVVPVSSFGQPVGPFGFGQVPVNSFRGSGNVPPVFPPPPVSTSPGTSGGVFGSSNSDRHRPSFDSSSSTGSTLAPHFPRPSSSRRVFSGKSGSASTASSSSSPSSTSAKTTSN